MDFSIFLVFVFAMFLISFLKIIIINSLVSFFTFRVINCNIKDKIIKISLFTVLSEFIAFSCLIAFFTVFIFDSYREYNFLLSVLAGVVTFFSLPNMSQPESVVVIVCGILISAILIFLLTYFIALKNTELTKKQRLFISIVCAIVNSPYHFLISL